MSVAPRAAPSMSERSRVLSRRGSNREEEELAVGAVIVMLSDKTEDQSAAYRPSIAIGDVGQDDSKSISTTSPQKEQRFVAVLAPSCDAAMASLLSQPPGTYLLVKEEDTAITVYVKFRQAVRALTLVKGKDVKKNDDAIHLAKSRKKDIDVLMQTPVHTLRLASEAYFLVEHCWKRFLPQVQAVVFELCCEPYLDEDTKLEDWNSSMIPADYSLALMPEACGFYILASHSAGPESASSAVIQVRQVEFDFNKFAITVADGTLKPSALLLSTSFSAKRTFEPYFTFTAIRDNFMSPDQVILKETSVSTTIPTQQTSLQNCIDLSSNDKELSILSAAEAACGSVMPHESLPETFVTVICEMHVHFTDVTTNLGANPLVKPAPWSAQKMKLLSLRFLYNKASFRSWDRDVALLLRLEDLYQHLFTEIICIVRRRAHLQDVNAKDALTCELRVVIACVSTLFRLERKRRQEISSASGDKKYSSFILLFRTKLRDFNERLKGEASSNDGQAEEAQTEGEDQIDEVDERFLVAMVEVFRWIPRAFLDEWIVLSLKELLQVLDALNGVTKQTPIPMVKQLQYIRHIHESFQVFAVIMKRISDPDLQKILVRVLGMDCSSIVSLLRFALSTNTLCLNGGRDAVCVQKFALSFLGAFVNLDVALPVQTEWDSRNAKSCEDGCMNEDQEIIEQLKGELLIRLLGPRMLVDDGEQNEQNLWDFIIESLFPTNGANTASGSSRMLSIAASFRSVATPPTLLTAIARGHFQMKERFLQLQQALYTAQDVNSSVDYDVCIASHMRHIGIYFDRIIDNTAQEEKYMVYRAAELHFRCLVVLASRRSQCPAIQEAFNNAHVVATIVKWLQTQTPQHDTTSGVPESVEISSAVPCLPPLKLPRQHGATDSFSSQPGIAKLTLAAPHSVPFHKDVPFPQHFLLFELGLHALAIVLLVSFVIVEPNLEIDEEICPRVSVPRHDTSTSDKPNELLWTLQQHLVAVEMDQRYFEALTLEMETLQAFVSTARLSAIRLMLRLLCPNRFDRNLYMNTSQTKSENAVLVSSKHSREYIAKGAFSTVYKQHPALPRPEAVAIKVVEHQRRAGELCAVSGLYNEVSILSKLRGDLAATQLVDFGNHHAEQNFEIVMEYCPCSLTEWRATIDRSDSGTPFRSCLVMILRAFEEACHCLSRVHQAGVCHFDIKSDNILVRSSAQELSRRLLENDDELEDEASNREFKAWLCIADFGESKLVNSHQLPVRTFTFSSFTSGSAFPVAAQRTEKSMSLSRTRGTEAIKSPEVLKIKGSEDVEVKVTLASDIWSLGCLLFELVTQELLFQNDDWAGLYAHLVVTQDQAVLRSDHRQKVFDALRPSSSDEEEVVTAMTEICSKILCRDASKRPDLAAITAHARKLINDVYEMPVTASDESFIISLYQSSGETSASADAHRSLVPTLELFASPAPRSRRADANGVTVPVRFFWNFFLAAHITKTQDSQTVTSCVGNGHGPVSKDVLAMEAFEAKHEGDFVHFVYLAWHDNSAPPGGPDAHESLIEELYEDEHRTVFLLNPHLKASVETQLTSDVHLFQQLVQHAPHYFPVLQRRLREEAGCVVFVVLGKGEEDSKELQHVLTGMLLFFLRSAVAMTPFELLSCFARDCAQFFDYPRSEFLQHLLSYSTPVTEDTATSTVIQCRCGSSVLRVESSAMSEALTAQRCTCQASDKSDSECPSFHPFPLSVDDGSEDADDDVHPVDSMFEHDDCEEQLVYPIESRSRRGQEVPWLYVDAASVSRADGSAFRWSPAGPRLGSSDSTRSVGSGSERRMSRFGLLKRRASKGVGDASPRLSGKEETQEPQELLVRGLQRRGKPADADSPSSDKWELYECELCRLPICALSEGKVAVPLLHPRSSD
ncbi:hypothetical protein PR003_g13804 [Phytophthora rubi]|uniref:Protein kinase domain-containing protein n=1 Tax=Phytophthora rubi TaxID=129364 RepID=A0A6A4F183_9STRA|nr:hypothetical protein PR003_g13804 [Phytophthora rubi]